MKGPAMTKTAYAVIGAGFGDEGKGLATDYLAMRLWKNNRVTVVRSNGGAQAGHTVQTPSGDRHIFQHIGSGTFAMARTHLSQFFVAHPMRFGAEYQRVTDELNYDAMITIDPRAPVTTPWDVLVNQIVETARADGRHGSCGMGFGETLERHENGPKLIAADLYEPGLEKKLSIIAEDWFHARLEALGVEPTLPGHLHACAQTDGILQSFLLDCGFFTDHVRLQSDATLWMSDHLIFEGAQGLGLDMDLGEMPHVTRSRTGLANMVTIAKEAGIGRIKALYMTRAYATRHGAGPFPHEEKTPDFVEVNDPTNATNEWQGSLRVAPLDLDVLAGFIEADLERAGYEVAINPALGVSCLDQLQGDMVCIAHGKRIHLPLDRLQHSLPGFVHLPVILQSHGPTRDDVSFAVWPEPKSIKDCARMPTWG
jgi:adenylosuccinate synthase